MYTRLEWSKQNRIAIICWCIMYWAPPLDREQESNLQLSLVRKCQLESFVL